MIGTLENEIHARLAPLEAESIELHDDSAAHAGHAGSGGGGHFDVIIVAAAFTGLSKLARHRKVYELLADLIPTRIHALSIKALAPEEF
ncbi:BolA family transcriptional regulator [Silvimonas sp. JCM 19000]